uniref:Uncharacterized protein n=1 Tax=viral metagenome TaxID=1070528 RepID=A0A6M3L0G1_9ZZZZ
MSSAKGSDIVAILIDKGHITTPEDARKAWQHLVMVSLVESACEAVVKAAEAFGEAVGEQWGGPMWRRKR